MFASAFTSEGLGPGLRYGWDALAVICLVCGIILFLVSFFWNYLTKTVINSKLASSAIELGNDARWWAVSLMLIFIYVLFSPFLSNLANIGDIGAHIYPISSLKTNRISWNFEDQQHPPFFLAFEKTNISSDTAFFGFQAHGKNNSDKPISHVSRIVKSYITNKEFPIKLLVQGRPVDPDQTNGIPPFADFDVVTLGSVISIMNGVIQTKAEDIGEFTEFSFEFDYDGNKFVRVFTKQEVQKQKEMWADISDPAKSSVPHVTLKEPIK
jgi:hypothetical protein